MGSEGIGLLYVPIRVQFVPSCVARRGNSCNGLRTNELFLHLNDPVLELYGKLPPWFLPFPMNSARLVFNAEVDSGLFQSFKLWLALAVRCGSPSASYVAYRGGDLKWQLQHD